MTDTYNSNLEAIALTKIYPASGGHGGGGIQPIDINLKPGTFFTLLGPSGCGKTTTLRCLAGLEVPDSGTIRLGDKFLFNSANGANIPLNRRNIGMVFQSYAIWPHMTVFENVAFPLRVANDEKYSSDEIKRLVGDALQTVDMSPYAQRGATQLSGGQQQRVALARAIVRKPSLLLLDEPLSNLDARLRDDMRTELKRLQRQLGITTIYVTHDQSEALDMSDQIAVINKGHLVQLGSPREIYFRPKDAFVAGFLGSVNLLPGNIQNSSPDRTMAKVTLDLGVDVISHTPHALAAGRVVVSVRPEAIELRKPGTPQAHGFNQFDGRIIASGFLGYANRYIVDVGGQSLQVATSPQVSFAAGDQVALAFSQDDTIGLMVSEGEPTAGPAVS